jgi:hypothetical protein
MAVSQCGDDVLLLPSRSCQVSNFFRQRKAGWLKLFGLAMISQVAGQSLIAHAMAHLPATPVVGRSAFAAGDGGVVLRGYCSAKHWARGDRWRSDGADRHTRRHAGR